MRSLYFPARDLAPHAEPVDASTLEEGRVYFALGFLDTELLIPTLEPVVFIGKALEPGDNLFYFQDAESYRCGVRYDSQDGDGEAVFTCGEKPSHIYDFEYALNQLMLCSLRRAEHRGDSQ